LKRPETIGAKTYTTGPSSLTTPLSFAFRWGRLFQNRAQNQLLHPKSKKGRGEPRPDYMPLIGLNTHCWGRNIKKSIKQAGYLRHK
jgi:hypothetical protein